MPASPAFACVLRAAERQTVGACDQSPRCAGHAGRSYVPAIAGAGRGRRIVGVGCPSSACVVRAASPSPVGRCSRHSSSAADGGRAGDASADYLGSIPVRSRRSCRRATPATLIGVSGRPTRAWALSTDIETPRCSDQLNENSAAHATVEPAIASFVRCIFFMNLLHYWLAPC